MKRTKYILVALTVAGLSHTAYAFQEQNGKAATEGAAAAAPGGLAVPSSPLPKTGAEIRIPGLGQIGTLPKFDFGLELLYGASEPKGVREELNKSEPSDLQIRGTLKYKFPN